MVDKSSDFIANYFVPQDRVQLQSTPSITLPDSTLIKSVSSKQDQSSSSSSSASSLSGNSPKSNTSSFLKVSPPNERKTNSTSPENGFLMTLIRSTSIQSQRNPSNEPVGAGVNNDEQSTNGKFIRNKVTAALNHMKYRKNKSCSIDEEVK